MTDTILARGFTPAATAIAVRTIGSCYAMGFRPDDRPMIGVGVFTVMPENGAYRFDAEARALRDGELPPALLDWLEQRMPERGSVIS